MSSNLVRMLSTGRNGTKFMASVFADQGYRAFHEDLYVGEPFVAVKHYLNWLGDLWIEDRADYYAHESRFARPYRGAVLEALKGSRAGKSEHGVLTQFFKPDGGPATQSGVVVHSAHALTTATPLIQRDLAAADIDVRNLVLLRNPLRTIHAIYTIESPVGKWRRPYGIRPALFSTRADFLGAAQIWANTYRLIHDVMEHLGSQYFRTVRLEQFSADAAYAEQVFAFLDLDFDPDRFLAFTDRVLNEPLRAAKTASVRNSDLYAQPEFAFDARQIEAIGKEVADVNQLFGIDWPRMVEEYVQFHAKEKERLGFRGAE